MTRFKRLEIHLPLLLLLTVVSVTLRTVALFKEYGPWDGYFNDKLLITISDGIVFGGMLILLSFAFISPKFKVVPSFTGPATFIPSGLVCCGLIFLSFDMVMSVVKLPGKFLSRQTLSQSGNLLALVTATLALVCIINFFFTVFYSASQNETRAFWGIITVIFLALYASYLYFDTKLPLNAPNKAVDQLAFLLAALFFLYETRISLGREMWRGYCAFGLIASLATAYSSIPSLIYYLGSGDVASDSLSAIVLTFSLFIYITARLVLVNFLLSDEKSETAIAVEALSMERSEQLALPDQERIINKEENFNTLGENYEFDLHISEIKANDEEEEADGSDNGN